MAGVTLVKVCGLTRDDDVRLAAELGAWALGFVLTESPRRVAAPRAAELVTAARESGDGPGAQAPHTVAVVTTESPAWIADALAESGADGVQLSAGADGPSVTDVRAAAARLRLTPLVIAAADTPDARLADLVLLDARTAGAYGGTGETLDWDALAADPGTPRRRPRPGRRAAPRQRRRGDPHAASRLPWTSRAAWRPHPAARTTPHCVTSSPPWYMPTEKRRLRRPTATAPRPLRRTTG